MPRIPKKIPMRSATFPQPRYRSANGEYNRYNPIAAKAYKEDLGLEIVQGPDMPLALENRRQAIRNAMEEYEAEMAAERERQLLNRRAQVWNEYVDLPRRAKQFYRNRDDIARYLVDYDYIPDELEAWKTTRDLPTFDRWSKGRTGGKNYTLKDLGEYEGPTDLPPEFIDEPPWRY
jgi:hypothetical protein